MNCRNCFTSVEVATTAWCVTNAPYKKTKVVQNLDKLLEAISQLPPGLDG